MDVNWDLMSGNIVAHDTTVILADSSVQKMSHSTDAKVRQCSASKLLEMGLDEGPKSKIVEVLEDGTSQQRDSSYLNEKTVRMYRNLPMSHYAYDELPITSADDIALVIGGETHGLSSAAHKLAHEHGGLKVPFFLFVFRKTEKPRSISNIFLSIGLYPTRKRSRQLKCWRGRGNFGL